MDGVQAVEADDAVELVDHAVEVADDVVAGIPHMARVQAHAHVAGQVPPAMMAASSSNVPPTSLPFPAIVSKSSVVVWCGRSDWLSASAIFAMASSCVWPVALPGCMLYSWCGVSLHAPQILGQHHEREVARLLLVGGGVQRVGRVRQDALDRCRARRIGRIRRHVLSVDGLRAPAARVLRVKNWNVLASMDTAVFAMWR